MELLITGGTGLIGSHFIARYSDYRFTVLTRSVFEARKRLPDRVKLISSLDVLSNLDDFDAVINLAGEPIIDKRWSGKQKTVIQQSRWEITQRLVDLFARSQHPPETFLSGSAIGIYGDRGDELLTEASVVGKNDFPTEICTRWEEIASQAEPYTRVILLRTGIVLTPEGGALARMLLPFKCCLGGRLGTGQQYMSWIHLQDYLDAMHFLLKATRLSGPVNLVAPKPEMNHLFVQMLAKTLHRVAVLPMPEKLLQLLLGESACLLLNSQRVIPQVLLESGYQFRFQELEAALINLLNDKPNETGD